MLGKLDAALVDFNKAIDLAPDVSMYYHSRGMCFQQMDKKQEAIDEFKHALSLNSHQVASSTLKARILNPTFSSGPVEVPPRADVSCHLHRGNPRPSILGRPSLRQNN